MEQITLLELQNLAYYMLDKMVYNVAYCTTYTLILISMMGRYHPALTPKLTLKTIEKLPGLLSSLHNNTLNVKSQNYDKSYL